jgi:hypothetical protein
LHRSNALWQLHARFCAGDDKACDELAAILLPLLSTECERRYPQVELDIRHDAVLDELLFYLSHPQDFRPLAHGLGLNRLIGVRVHRALGTPSAAQCAANSGSSNGLKDSENFNKQVTQTEIFRNLPLSSRSAGQYRSEK